MPSIINTNMSSLIAQRQLNKSQMANQTAMTRLSSGLRINSAKDDAAGQAISERLTAQVRGFNQAARNANDGTSLAQTTENGLGEVGNLLQRLREIAVQSASDTNSLGDRQALDSEAKELIAEVNNISQTTQFNGKGVLNGDTKNFDFQVGAFAGQAIRVSSVDARAAYLGGNMVRGHALFLNTTTGNKGYATGDFTSIDLNGTSVDLSATGAKASSIDDVIAAVNKISESTGISALRSSRAVVEADEFGGAALASGDTFLINGVKVAISAKDPAALTQDEVLASINAVADKSGVRAEVSDISAADSVGNIKLVSNGDIVISADSADPNAQTPAALQQGTYFRGINFINKNLEGATGGTNTAVVTLAMGAAGGTQAADAGRMAAIAAATVTDESNQELVRDYTVQNLNMSTKQGAEQAIDTLDFAINQVNGMRGKMGALQNRFQSAVSNLQSMSENITSARSRIQDADFAAETAELSRTQVLQQAGTAMLSQANASSQNVLSLLR